MRRFYQFIAVNFIITFIVAGLFLWKKDRSAHTTSATTTSQKPAAKKDDVEISSFNSEAGWGYTISIQGKPYVRQNTIPAIEGNKGFASREKALLAGEFVAYKIRNSIVPPSVSRQELDSLHLLN